MVSFCIKTNKQSDIISLTSLLSNIDLPNVIFVVKKFSKYSNIIIHYVGNDTNLFYEKLSNVLCAFIIEVYEPIIINRLLIANFFYFDTNEIAEIKNLCLNKLHFIHHHKTKKNILLDAIINYIRSSKSMILSGFINFRIYKYTDFLSTIADSCVNEFVVNKEYYEFIELLKLYINSKNYNSSVIHLIYVNSESILLDENKKIISLSHNNLDLPYLSDITFSSNDYALNSLLSLLPKKLVIHLVDEEDDFINTLKLIFDDRVSICRDCNICNTYRLLKKEKNIKKKSLHI